MGLFQKKKKNDPLQEAKDALKLMKENLASVQARLRNVRADEATANTRYHNLTLSLEDNERYLKLAEQQGNEFVAENYRAKVGILTAQNEKARVEAENAHANTLHVAQMAEDLAAQIAELEKEIIQLDRTVGEESYWYYREEEPAKPKAEEPAAEQPADEQPTE